MSPTIKYTVQWYVVKITKTMKLKTKTNHFLTSKPNIISILVCCCGFVGKAIIVV